MTHKYGWIFACGWCFLNVAESVATESTLIEQKVIQAIVDIAEAPHSQWAKQISHYENEEGNITSSIERFAPNDDISKQWTLVRINDKIPTKKQLKKFAKKKRKHAKDKAKGKSYSINFKTLIMQDSLHLVTENDTTAEVGFKVHMEKLGDDAIGKLEGVLSYDKQEQFIKDIRITNNAEFSPMFSAKISDIELTFNFIKLNDIVLPKEVGMRMKGSFAYFTEIDEVSTTTYTDYQQTNLVPSE